MAKPGRPKKERFDMLSNETKDAIQQSSVDEIKNRIYKTALESSALKKARAEDEDLKAKKETVKQASEGYTKGLKMNEQTIEFSKMVLEGKGVKTV